MRSFTLLFAGAVGAAIIPFGCARRSEQPRIQETTPSATSQAPADSIQRLNTAQMQAILASIRGRENEPAGQVFTNIRMLQDVPARTLLAIMNGGYARALGVSCTHCHVADNFASDEKRPKRAAREMAVMHRSINQQLARMTELTTPATGNRSISCIACHRGTIDPR